MSQKEVDVIIPVYKPDKSFTELIKRLMKQSVRPKTIFILQTIRDESDCMVQSLEKCIRVIPVLQSEFDHGGTRALGMEKSDAEFALLMTQDAMPADNRLIEKLLESMDDEQVGVAYARQMVGKHAGRIERMSRLYNYPAEGYVRSDSDKKKYGIKTYFCSDVCALYRKAHYKQAGGFVQPTIFNEDMIMAYHMMKHGYRVAYQADARVFHSHNYTCRQMFARNFDLGVSHKQYEEIFSTISSEKEGAGYAVKMIKALAAGGHFLSAVYFCIQCACRLAGYRLGLVYDKLPRKVLLKCTGSAWYWQS